MYADQDSLNFVRSLDSTLEYSMLNFQATIEIKDNSRKMIIDEISHAKNIIDTFKKWK